jgi:hypothetical protein
VNAVIAYRSFVSRFTIAAGLAVAVLGGAAMPAPAAGIDPIGPAPVRTLGPVTSLSTINVQPGGTVATVSFTSSEPTSASVSVKPAGTSTGGHLPVAGGVALPTSVAVSIGDTPSVPVYETSHSVKLTQLKPNTAYDVDVSAQTQSGVQLSGQAHFSTYHQRVRVTFDGIDITQGGAMFGDASPRWFGNLAWRYPVRTSGAPDDASSHWCFPIGCDFGSYGDGYFHPGNKQNQPLIWVFADENFDQMPNYFEMYASGQVDDWFQQGATLGKCASPDKGTWQVPEGVEYSWSNVNLCADDGQFHSTVTFRFEVFYDNSSYPASRNSPFSSW